MVQSIRRVLPALALFVIAPLIAEFLLGNMSITHLGLLVILAPLYGGGALPIRESVRRAGRPWPSIFLLALAFGILEEAFLTESLFNPNYLGLNLHFAEYRPHFSFRDWSLVHRLCAHASHGLEHTGTDRAHGSTGSGTRKLPLDREACNWSRRRAICACLFVDRFLFDSYGFDAHRGVTRSARVFRPYHIRLNHIGFLPS